MQERNKYTKIEDFLADASFKCWVRTNADLENWEEWTLEKPIRAKLVQESRLWILATKVTENNLPSSIVKTALLTTWNKIEKNETSGKKKIKLWKSNWLRSVAAVFVFGLLTSWAYSHFLFLDILPKSTMN
jgi:DNA recombination-dependent growth factor C